MQQRIITEMETYLQALSEEERIAAINAFRQALHEISPFRDQPVDCVLWIKKTNISANDYNPNAPQHYEIVDGFHRHDIGSNRAPLKRQLKGYLPVTCLRKARQEKFDRMAATIRHNRARGRHQINAMSEIVRELVLMGWSEQKIGQELGMDSDEVLRLKQINGLLELFADRRFSEAWTVK